MALITWTGKQSGVWTDAANWSPNTTPQANDTVIVPSKTPHQPEISQPTISNLDITMGGADGGKVTLTAQSVVFSQVTLNVTGGASGSPVEALFSCSGTTSFAGEIFVTAPSGSLSSMRERIR